MWNSCVRDTALRKGVAKEHNKWGFDPTVRGCETSIGDLLLTFPLGKGETLCVKAQRREDRVPTVQSDDDDDVMRTQGSVRPPSARDVHGGLQDQHSHGVGNMGSAIGLCYSYPHHTWMPWTASRHSNEKTEKQLSDLCIDATVISRRKKLMLDQTKKFSKLWLMILSFNLRATAGIGFSKSFSSKVHGVGGSMVETSASTELLSESTQHPAPEEEIAVYETEILSRSSRLIKVFKAENSPDTAGVEPSRYEGFLVGLLIHEDSVWRKLKIIGITALGIENWCRLSLVLQWDYFGTEKS
ncbi:hypothetical protein DUI87_25178 [Hirundo rustica rustica]|uniref:Uncharacterized protein n=1 Tax=Hirundo rustica rustica TaxID=333673 RepID=A0A3M0JH05_HIRRU|nr:hypothetical protein DUI87_25178 [Hirundo rustica rustica]